MKIFLTMGLLLTTSFAFGASTTSVPLDAGLKNVYVTDQFGNGLLDQSGGVAALSVSLGNTVAKSVVGKLGVSTTTSTSHAAVLSYSVSQNKTFYITSFGIEARLTAASATVSTLGTCALEIPSGTSVASFQLVNPTNGAMDRVVLAPTEPISVNAGTAAVIACDPGTATSTVFRGTFQGYEK